MSTIKLTGSVFHEVFINRNDIIETVENLAHSKFRNILGSDDFVKLDTGTAFIVKSVSYHNGDIDYTEQPATKEQIELQVFRNILAQLKEK